MKPKWNVSIAMQIMRVKHLHLINEDEEKRLWINLGRRKWRQVEPLDDSVPQEKPRLVNQSIKMLIDSGVKSPDQISKDLTMSPVDLDNLIEEKNFFSNANGVDKPRLKQGSDNVLLFQYSKNR